MPFVKRDARGMVIAVSQEAGLGFEEELPQGDQAIAAFLTGVGKQELALETSDKDLIRVLEDLVDLMVNKGLILFTELPVDAQQKIMNRQQLRSELDGGLNLLDDD
jgi:acyl-coenzyme A synthetase/AMP-(fatty) acid ligase